jgi:hypothetical protein
VAILLSNVRLPIHDLEKRLLGELRIYAQRPDTLRLLEEPETREFGEEAVQLFEGNTYEYQLNTSQKLRLSLNSIIYPSQVHSNSGRLEPGSYTGRVPLALEDENGSIVGQTAVEVCSTKLNYREDYRSMLEFITNMSSELLLEIQSPSQARFLPDLSQEPETIPQRFAFLKSILDSREFRDAIQRITSIPHRQHETRDYEYDVRRGFKPSSRALRQIARGTPRIPLPNEHPLNERMRSQGIQYPSLPSKITGSRRYETVDTAENRFVKYSLEVYFDFLTSLENIVNRNKEASSQRLLRDVSLLRQRLGGMLSQEFFKLISEPEILPLGSTVLQKREGYREILQTWLKFNLAARLVWNGGEDVYGAGKRDMATLYEYWLFFQLLNILGNKFKLETYTVHDLIERSKDGFNLKLKAGQAFAIRGHTQDSFRPIDMRFSYNRTFSFVENRAEEGSWTRSMRPDFTLSLWPSAFTADQAEQQELMVHIHFDSKYKVNSPDELFGASNESMQEEQINQRRGLYKRADLLKMHTYRDAIRRSEGSYILYPGVADKVWERFYEVLPGVGAFAVRPTVDGQAEGKENLSLFIDDILNHIRNRATRREKLSFYLFQAQHEITTSDVFIRIPELNSHTHLREKHPSEHFVLIAPYITDDHLDWIAKNGLYNLPVYSAVTTKRLEASLVGVRHVLLYKNTNPFGLWKVETEGIWLANRTELISLGCPDAAADDAIHAVFNITNDEYFSNWRWSLDRLISLGDFAVYPLPTVIDYALTLQ